MRQSQMMKFVARKSTVAVAVMAIGSVLASACGGGSPSSDSTVLITDDSSAVTVPAVPTFPLTGTELTDESVMSRPALAAKIDNHPASRPQTGLNLADIVFEENVEKLTRFAAVFHSIGSDPVGPLRSGRTQDVDILGSFNKPLFAWSGGNARVTNLVNKSDLVNVGWSASKGKGGYARDSSRRAPHNLYARTTDLWTLSPEGSSAPAPQFLYRGTSDAMPVTAIPVVGVKVSMDNVPVYWEWDATKSLFMRSSLNARRVLEPNNTLSGENEEQISAHNVVILYVKYAASEADPNSPEAQTVGGGVGYVLTNGSMIEVTWERADRLVPFTLKDSAGTIVRMTPGRTWVLLSRDQKLATVGQGVDPKSVDWPK
jgi:hypothetical protein